MRIDKIPAAERHKERYYYTVEGTGVFPIDMLRYDTAYPINHDDVEAIGRIHNIGYGKRMVRLCSCHRPRIDRWESFGWKVLDT